MDARESRLCDLKWIFSQWILDSFFSGILDSKSWILDSNAQYSGFCEQKFPGFRNPDYLTWGEEKILSTMMYRLQTKKNS